MLEGAVRIRQWVRYGSAGRDLFQTTIDPVSGLLVPVANQVNRRVRIDSHGFRNPELAVPKPAGTIRIAFLGESTVFSEFSTSNETTWPYLVWRKLQDIWPTQRFDFFNAAGAGYRVQDTLRALQYRVQPFQPDVIVIQHAPMDLYSDSEALAKKQGLTAGHAKPGYLETHSVLYRLLKKNIQIRLRSQQAESGRHLEFDPATLSQGFHRRLAELVERARQVAPVVVLVTVPTKARWDQSPQQRLRNASASLFYASWLGPDGFLKGMDEYNRVVREVAREQSVLLVDLDDSIPADDQDFYDTVHYRDPGSELVAQQVAQAMVRSVVIAKLMKSSAVAPVSVAKTGNK